MKFFKDDDFQFGLEIVLGATYHRAADVGEALATAGRIKDGDSDAWVREWLGIADRLSVAGGEAEQAGLRVSAVAYYRRAATYYATALYRFAYATDIAADRELEIWRRQRACWDRVVDLQAVPGERVTIPYEGTTLPGISSARLMPRRVSAGRWWCSTTAVTARRRRCGWRAARPRVSVAITG